MKYRKICAIGLVIMLLCTLTVPAFAEDSSQSFRLSLRSDGQQEISVPAGQEFTVTLTLERTDAAEEWKMYAWQTEIVFDPTVFTLLEDSVSPARGVGSSWHPGVRESRLYLNAYSISKTGSTYPASLEVGSFRLKALKTGSVTIRNENYLVSTAGGEDRYRSESSDLSVTVIAGAETSGQNGEGSGTPGGSGYHPDEVDFTDVFRFQDVPMDAWYVDAVTYTVQKGLFKGVSETLFAPQETMTRAMLVTVLHRMEGSPASAVGSGFMDVPSDTWYTDAVAWARENSVVEGYSDTQFGPDDPVTREQMAAILYRYTEKKGRDVNKTADLLRYDDESTVSAWAKQAMSWANAESLIIGRTEMTLNPLDIATRAEVAMILMRYCKMN